MNCRKIYKMLLVALVVSIGLPSFSYAARPYNPFVITVTDQQTGAPIPLVKLETVNKISFLTDSNGQIAFLEPGLVNVGDVYFHVTAPYGYKQLDADMFGNKGKTLKPTLKGTASFTLAPDETATGTPEYSNLEQFRLSHNYNVTLGTFTPFEIEFVDQATDRGIPQIELHTDSGLMFVTDSAGRIAFYEPDLMDTAVNFTMKAFGYSSPGSDTFTLTAESDGYRKIYLQRDNVAERLYRITGGGIYRDSMLLGKSVPLAKPVLNSKVLGQDTVDMTSYKGRQFWLWGDTDRPAYPLGNFKTTCAVSRLPETGGLDPSDGIDMTYFENSDGFAKAMFPLEGANLVWMNSLVSFDNDGEEFLLASYGALDGNATIYENGIAVFDDTTKEFKKLTAIEDGQNITPSSQAHKRDGYVYINCPYPTIRIKADLATFGDPSLYEAFTCLKPGTGFADGNTQVERDGSGSLVWGWKVNTSFLNENQWNTLVNNGIVQNGEAWNRVYDVDTGGHVMLATGSAGYNSYRDCWVMISQQQFGTSFLGEVWVSASKTPEGPWTKAKKIVTHTRSDMGYTFYNVAYHPEFDQDNGRFIYFEGTYTNTYTGSAPTPLYNYNQVMYRLDLSDDRLDDIWPEDTCVSDSYMRDLDFAGENTVIDDISTFVAEPDCEINLYDMLAFSQAWLFSGELDGTVFDISGPAVGSSASSTEPDNIVNLYDFALLSYSWLTAGEK